MERRETGGWSRRRLLRVVGSTTAVCTLAACDQATGGRPIGWLSRATPFGEVENFEPDLALDWFDLVLALTKSTPGYSPPVASRAFAYIGIALYQSMVGGMTGYASLSGKLGGQGKFPAPSGALHWGIAGNEAVAAMVQSLYPTTSAANKAAIAALRDTYRDAFGDGTAPGIVTKSRKFGQDVAKHVFDRSKTDGGHEGYTRNFPSSYVPPTGPGLWVPTPSGFSPALQPYWGNNRTLAVGNVAAVDPGPPTAYSTSSSSAFFAEAEEVRDAVVDGTPEQRIIAEFWSDDPGATATPPGHSISICAQVLAQRGANLAEAAEAFLKVGIAVSDAFVACWHTKYRYNLVRPVTYIREFIDSAWLPSLSTPPFPEYTSGHSVQSGAAAEVLADLFGNVAFTDHTHDDRGFAPRSFTSFDHFAHEAAISRLYGGIHFRPAIELGVDQGRLVGAAVNALPVFG